MRDIISDVVIYCVLRCDRVDEISGKIVIDNLKTYKR